MEEDKEQKVPLVYFRREEDRAAAEALAEHLHTRVVEEMPDEKGPGLVLCFEEDGLSLAGGGQSMKADFSRMIPRLKQANLEREFLVKAVRIKSMEHMPYVVDATAGMGEDSLLLAAAGCTVRLYEYDPVIAALLRDALRRGAEDPLLSAAVSRMELHEEDSIAALKALDERPDVVLLDPMFPERQKSALVKKKFQLLQQLEQPCSEEAELFDAALAAKPRKIVIKRPLKGPYLADRKPHYSMQGKAIRYDCMILVP